MLILYRFDLQRSQYVLISRMELINVNFISTFFLLSLVVFILYMFIIWTRLVYIQVLNGEI